MNLKTIGKLFGLGVALVLLALAVGNNGQTGLSQEHFWTQDEEFAMWVKSGVVPGFGGLFFDEEGNLDIFLTNLEYADSAREFFSRLLHEQDISIAGEIIFLQGQYDFLQLWEWKEKVMYAVAETVHDGIESVDIDERSNRLSIGVRDADMEPIIREALSHFSIPGEAVMVKEEGPAEPLSLFTPLSQTLRHEVRPTMGGLWLHNWDWNSCTLGFNARHRDYPLAFVTVAHCTTNTGKVDGDFFYQLNAQIGVEVLDPPFKSCYLIYKCRYSDSALVSYEGYEDRVGFEIARTDFNDIEIKGRYYVRFKQGIARPVIEGDILWAVGSQSGSLRGIVGAACKNKFYKLPNYWLLCQGVLEYVVFEGGDSGGPVYKDRGVMEFEVPKDGPTTPVDLYGIIWGVNRLLLETYFSPMWGIEMDLGDLRVSSR